MQILDQLAPSVLSHVILFLMYEWLVAIYFYDQNDSMAIYFYRQEKILPKNQSALSIHIIKVLNEGKTNNMIRKPQISIFPMNVLLLPSAKEIEIIQRLFQVIAM